MTCIPVVPGLPRAVLITTGSLQNSEGSGFTTKLLQPCQNAVLWADTTYHEVPSTEAYLLWWDTTSHQQPRGRTRPSIRNGVQKVGGSNPLAPTRVSRVNAGPTGPAFRRFWGPNGKSMADVGCERSSERDLVAAVTIGVGLYPARSTRPLACRGGCTRRLDGVGRRAEFMRDDACHCRGMAYAPWRGARLRSVVAPIAWRAAVRILGADSSAQ